MRTALTIAGFDPSSGAGVTADLMVFAAHGLFGTACITALTVQSTLGVRSTHPVAPEIVRDTLECLDADLPPSGIKIGMVADLNNTIIICNYLKLLHEKDAVSVVLDPILRSSSGRELLEPPAVALLRERLLPLVSWVTPNLDELAILAGETVRGYEDMARAAKALQAGSKIRPGGERLGVFATGGHLDPPDDLLLLPDGEEVWFRGERVPTRSTHGTGCALSSAFLSRLILGDSPSDAARNAKEYVVGGLKSAIAIGAGNGPINHLWKKYK